MKYCPKCEADKLDTDFNKSCARKDGLAGWCKLCSKIWRASVKQRDKHKKQKYYLDNKESHLKKAKESYIKNKDKILARRKERYILNSKKEIAKRKIWAKNNPEKVRLNARIGARKRRALKIQVNENYNAEDEYFTRQLFSDTCFKCHGSDRIEIDHHYPLDKGFALTKDNAVLLCKSCNTSKQEKMPEEFYSEAELYKLELILSFGTRSSAEQ